MVKNSNFFRTAGFEASGSPRGLGSQYRQVLSLLITAINSYRRRASLLQTLLMSAVLVKC